jgi:hypothetical protein
VLNERQHVPDSSSRSSSHVVQSVVLVEGQESTLLPLTHS